MRNWHWLPVYHPHKTPYGVTIGSSSPGGSKEPGLLTSRDRGGSFHWANVDEGDRVITLSRIYGESLWGQEMSVENGSIALG